jgi:hypothetical protein
LKTDFLTGTIEKVKRDDLRVGDLIAFQIGEEEWWSAPNKDRWGVIKVLHLGEGNFITVSVLDGLSDRCPNRLSLRFRKLLHEKRFKGRPNTFQAKGPTIFTSVIDGDLPLKSARIIGHERIFRPSEKEALPKIQKDGHGGSIGNIAHIASALDHEDRAINDTERWNAEIKLYEERRRLEREREDHRQRTRLKGITLDALLTETQFPEWDRRTDIVPTEFTAQMRDKVKLLLCELGSLGPKPRKAAARALVLGFVDWVNGFDDLSNNRIETEEREELMQFLEEVCWAIKQKSLLEEIDERRNW